MGVYDKIQVAMIAILVKFENISRATEEKSARKCAASSEFLFCLKLLLFLVFFFYHQCHGSSNLLAALPRRKILDV